MIRATYGPETFQPGLWWHMACLGCSGDIRFFRVVPPFCPKCGDETQPIDELIEDREKRIEYYYLGNKAL